jgi:AraC-like DNA-binding protein
MNKQDAGNIRSFSLSKMEYVQVVFGNNITNAFPRHVHKAFCIGIIDKGARVIYHRERSTVVPEGGLFVINPGEPHTCKSYNKEGQSYRILCVDANFVQSFASQISGKAQDIPYFVDILISNRRLAHRMCYFFSLIDQPNFTLSRESALVSLLSELILCYTEKPPVSYQVGFHHRAIGRVREYIEENYAKNLSLKQLSQVAGLSPFHFQRVFLKITGISPHDYLVQFRIKKAREFFLEGVGLAEVALETGFADQSHFTRFFKRIVGIPPGKYLRLHKK